MRMKKLTSTSNYVSFNMGIRMPGFVAALRTVPDKQKKI